MNLYVGNLAYETTNESLTDLFSRFGQVVSAKIITDRDSGQSKGFAFIEMSTKKEGVASISQLDGKEVDGRKIKVNEAQKKSTGSNSRW